MMVGEGGFGLLLSAQVARNARLLDIRCMISLKLLCISGAASCIAGLSVWRVNVC